MAYVLNKTDGSELTELLDNVIDQTTIDLTLIGKNASNYGEVLNENFIRLLENFSNTSPPNFPITGQIWYDSGENRLKIYDGTQFRTSGGPIVSTTTPSSFIQGDIWINNTTNQMYFYDGVDLLLAGPIYTNEQGISGPEVVSVQDSSGNLKTIVKIWVGQSLLGIWSKEQFTPATPIIGFSGIIRVGFNASSLSGAKFHVTATRADALVDPLGDLKTTASFVSTETNSNTIGTLSIQNTTPLIVGPSQNNEVRVSTASFQMVSNNAGQDFRIKVRDTSVFDALVINPVGSLMGVFTANPTAALDVTGDIKVSGNITLTAGKFFPKYTVVTANHIATAGERLIVDHISPLTVTLPASPSVGDYVAFIDGSSDGFAVNNLTIARNGSEINNAASNLVISTSGTAFTLVYTANRGWVYDNYLV
jgi:hypothetical protein